MCDKYKGKPGRRTKSEIAEEGEAPEAAESKGQQSEKRIPVEE
jgi:hypothetical protein